MDRIYRALLMNGKEPPQYVEQGDSVRLIVLSHLKRQRSIDRATAAAVCQRSERETGEILAEMTRLGLVERRGTKGGATYILPARLAHLAGDEAAYMRDRGLDVVKWREMVLEYARRYVPVPPE